MRDVEERYFDAMLDRYLETDHEKHERLLRREAKEGAEDEADRRRDEDGR